MRKKLTKQKKFLLCGVLYIAWAIIMGVVIANTPYYLPGEVQEKRYTHENRMGQEVMLNGERLKILNFNFWAGTYTMSNGRQIDDKYIDSLLPKTYKVELKERENPFFLIEGLIFCVMAVFICAFVFNRL